MKEFDELYKENYKRVYMFLYHMSSDAAAAEELTQETFFQAYVSLHKFKGNSEIFTWLAAIAKHVYLKYLKKHNKALDEMALEPVMETLVADTSQPYDAAEREFVQKRIREVIKSLPQKYGEVIMLRIYAEMSFSQVAQTLGISENSAKVIFCRAKKMLAVKLEDLK